MNELRTAAVLAAEKPDTHTPARPGGAVLFAPSRAVPGIAFALFDRLDAAEPSWRAFEAHADCTVFQTFDYLSAWQTHIGAREGIAPAVVEIRRDGFTRALLPLAVAPSRLARRLIWLGQDVSDYLAPLLAPDFASSPEAEQFEKLWREILELLQSVPHLRHDMIDLRKMPGRIGAQENPFLRLPLQPNPSGAHLATLSGDWESYYANARSASTRRRDRTKRKRLAESGEVRMVTPQDDAGIARTLATLVAQKSRALRRMGIADLFARPGVREFYLALATGARTREFVHVSRLDVGEIPASVNLGFRFRGRYYYVFASYDDGELSRYGPGAAHLRDLMADAIANGLREFDFTIGDERYKYEWADTETRMYDYIAASTARGAPAALLMRASTRLKRAVKRTPWLWNLVVRLRALAARLRPAR